MKDGDKKAFDQGLRAMDVLAKAFAAAIEKTKASESKVDEILDQPDGIYRFFEELFTAITVVNKSPIIRLVSVDEIIEALDGKTTIAKADKIFNAYIDTSFKKWKLDKPGVATKETGVKGYELIQDANFITIFGQFNNLDEACFTQAQIVRFCEKYPSRLKRDCNNFFLFKENDEYFLACVLVESNDLLVFVNRLSRSSIWLAVDCHHLFVPATCTLA